MTTCDEMTFMSKVHLHIKYTMASHLLEASEFWNLAIMNLFRSVAFVYFPSNFHLSHFLLDCPLPLHQSGVLDVLYRVWQLDIKLVGSAPGDGLDIGDDVVTMMQYLGEPPLEGRFFNETICNCILGQFDGIGFLEVLSGTQSSA